MKKLFTLFAGAALFSTALSAQTIVFSEDFDGVGGSTAGGAGTYTFPAGWSLFNVDALTPATGVSYVNDAWERREDLNNLTDSAAYSTSWYSPAGTADDWMFTPAIASLPANAILTWNAITLDPAYPDGYEVRIMTTAPTTGNLMTSTILLSVTPENTVWTAHSVSLAAYAGQTVYIGFRNNSTDEFLLLIDDVTVGALNQYDAALTAVDSMNQYTMIPTSNSASVHLGGTVANAGTNAVTNVVVTAQVYNSANNIVHTATSAPIASLAPATTNTFSMPVLMLSALDSYHVNYTVSIAETDAVAGNNAMAGADTLQITDTIFARDNGPTVGFLGIGAGVGGYLGQEFLLTQASNLTSISGFLERPYSSYMVQFAVFPDSAGQPTMNPIATTAAVSLSAGSPGWLTLALPGPVALPAGKFTIAVVEIDSIARLGQCQNEFTAGSSWVYWSTTPLGGWGHNEDFGANFAHPYMLRANFGQFVGTETVAEIPMNISVFPNPSNGQFSVNYNFTAPTDATINVYNPLGEIVKTITIPSATVGAQTVDLGCESAGIYFVEMVTPEGKNTTSVSVQ